MKFTDYAPDAIDDKKRSELLSKNWRLVTGGYWSQSPANHGYSAFFCCRENSQRWVMICLEIMQQDSWALPKESEGRRRFLMLNGDVSFLEMEGAAEDMKQQTAAKLLFDHYLNDGGVPVDEIDQLLGVGLVNLNSGVGA